MYPQKVALVHGDRRYTYAELGERAWRLANALRAAGLEKGDRVAVLLPSCPAMLEAHYGVPAAGGILVTVNTRLSSGEIEYILEHSGARYLLVDAEFEELIEAVDLSGLRVIRVDDTGGHDDPYEQLLADASPAQPESWL
jgi:fatty-acyl-CoA synthase